MKNLPIKKRWILVALISTGLLFFLGLFLLHRLIEKRIEETNVISARLHLLEQKTGLVLRHGAIRFAFLRGMVLTGVSVFEKDDRGNEVPLLSSGQAVLGFPLGLSSEPTPTRLSIEEGHLHLRSLSGAKTPPQRLTSLVRFLREAGMDLQAADLQIDDLADEKDLPSRDLRLFFSLNVREREQASLHGELRFENRAVMNFDSTWKEAEQERVFLRIHDMPVRLPHLWSGSFPYLPERFDVLLSGGKLNGDGSIDLTGDGYALHLRGNYEDTALSVPGFRGFSAKGLAGEYDQMIVGSYAKGPLHSRLKVNSDLFVHSTAIDRDQATRTVNYRYEGSLHLKPGPNLTLPTAIEAEVDYNIGLEKKALRDRETMRMTVDAKVKRLTISPSEAWASIPSIHIENGVFKGDGPIGFALPGKIGQTEFQFGGRIVPEFFSVDDETIFKHNTEFTLDIKEVSLNDLVEKIGALNDDLQKYVNGPDAVRAEDSGPVWENKFITHPIYRRYVEPAVVNGTVRIQHLTDTSPDMPSSLSFRVRHRIPMTEILLDSVASDATHIDGHYRVAYDAMLPQHSARFELRYSGSGYTSRVLCQKDTRVDPVQQVELKYDFQAEGIYLADLYFKSVTGYYLKMKHLPVEQDYRADLLRRLAEVDDRGLRYVDLDIQRNSAGSLFKPIIVKAEDDQAALAGSGEFNVYEGGFLQFQYFLKKAARQGRFQIRIRPDHVWIPSS